MRNCFLILEESIEGGVCLSWIIWDKTSSGLLEIKIVESTDAFDGSVSVYWYSLSMILSVRTEKSRCLKSKNRWGRNTGGEINFLLCILGLRAWVKAANLNHVMILSNGVAANHLQNKLSLLCFSRDGCLMLEKNRMMK